MGVQGCEHSMCNSLEETKGMAVIANTQFGLAGIVLVPSIVACIVLVLLRVKVSALKFCTKYQTYANVQ